MTINVRTGTIVNINLTDDELKAMVKTMQVLRNVREQIGDGVELVSVLTGAVVDTDDLPYINGILDEIISNSLLGGFTATAK
jgi:hypothetical protein